ncbi:replication fork protection component Swi3-domain-containing protein [Blastocladiella britannica]|nr:replication fork protection component Swi3-domain-containing protein [Blastocladiella britannica]
MDFLDDGDLDWEAAAMAANMAQRRPPPPPPPPPVPSFAPRPTSNNRGPTILTGFDLQSAATSAAIAGTPSDAPAAALLVPKPARAKLDEDRLLKQDAFPHLIKVCKDIKFKQTKGHEAVNLARLIDFYKTWAHGVFPAYPFERFVDRSMRLCRTKGMKAHMGEWVRRETRGGPDHDDENGDGDDMDDGTSRPDAPASPRAPAPLPLPLPEPPRGAYADDDDWSALDNLRSTPKASSSHGKGCDDGNDIMPPTPLSARERAQKRLAEIRRRRQRVTAERSTSTTTSSDPTAMEIDHSQRRRRISSDSPPPFGTASQQQQEGDDLADTLELELGTSTGQPKPHTTNSFALDDDPSGTALLPGQLSFWT